MTEALTKKEIRRLKAQAHHLKPVVMVGDAGLSASVLAEAENAIAHHELIKVKLPAGDRDSRAALTDTLCDSLNATLVQRVGRTAVVYRKADEDSAR